MKKIKTILIAMLILWTLAVAIDFTRVTRNFEKPLFCIATETVDDGGSGRYQGLGYSFDIKGNFMPDDENQGVTEYNAKLFGIFGMAKTID